MKILELIKPSLIGRTIRVYKKQEYNSRSHKNGRPAHYFSYDLRGQENSVYPTSKIVELKIVDVAQEYKDIAHWLILKLENGEELRNISYSTDLPII